MGLWVRTNLGTARAADAACLGWRTCAFMLNTESLPVSSVVRRVKPSIVVRVKKRWS